MQLKEITERQRETKEQEAGGKGEEEKDFRDLQALYTWKFLVCHLCATSRKQIAFRLGSAHSL